MQRAQTNQLLPLPGSVGSSETERLTQSTAVSALEADKFSVGESIASNTQSTAASRLSLTAPVLDGSHTRSSITSGAANEHTIVAISSLSLGVNGETKAPPETPFDDAEFQREFAALFPHILTVLSVSGLLPLSWISTTRRRRAYVCLFCCVFVASLAEGVINVLVGLDVGIWSLITLLYAMVFAFYLLSASVDTAVLKALWPGVQRLTQDHETTRSLAQYDRQRKRAFIISVLIIEMSFLALSVGAAQIRGISHALNLFLALVRSVMALGCVFVVVGAVTNFRFELHVLALTVEQLKGKLIRRAAADARWLSDPTTVQDVIADLRSVRQIWINVCAAVSLSVCAGLANLVALSVGVVLVFVLHFNYLTLQGIGLLAILFFICCVAILACAQAMALMTGRFQDLATTVNGLDGDRLMIHLLVHMIIDSDAGFFLFNVKITPQVVLRASYAVLSGVVYVLVKLISYGVA